MQHYGHALINWKKVIKQHFLIAFGIILSVAQGYAQYPDEDWCSELLNDQTRNVELNSSDCGSGEPDILLWHDEFDSTTLDLSKWRKGPSGEPFNPDSKLYWVNQFYAPFDSLLYQVSDGTVKLRTVRNTKEVYDDGEHVGTAYFAGGMLWSHQKFGYGRYEIKCKTPKGRGLFPAAWLHASGENFYYEIDLFEINHSPSDDPDDPNVWDDIYNRPKLNHWNKYTGPDGIAEDDKYSCVTRMLGNENDWHLNWHTYRIDYTPYELLFFIDGQLIKRSYRFRTRITNQNLTCGELPDDGIVEENRAFPNGTMGLEVALMVEEYKGSGDERWLRPTDIETDEYVEIDYIRHWVRGNCADQVVTNNDRFGPDYEKDFYNRPNYNYLVGRSITFSDQACVPAFAYLEAIGSERIRLEPGFKAASKRSVDALSHDRPMSGFLARLDEKVCTGEVQLPVNQPNYPEPKLVLKALKDGNAYEIDPDVLFTLYPNAANASVVLRIDHQLEWGRKVKVTVINTLGEVVYDTTYRSEDLNEVKVDVSDWSKGVYQVNVFDGIITATKKLVVN